MLDNPALYDAVAYEGARTSEPFELRSGLHLHYGPLDDPAYLFLELFVHDIYRLRRWYRPKAGDIICDIGGNIGWFALACCHRASGAIQIHSFEPDPDSCSRFRQNIDANALSAQVTIEQFAIANSVRTSRLSRTHPLRRQLGQHGVAVSCLNLEEALTRTGKPIALLKIDVEGGESDILTEPAMLSDVRRVALEWHSADARSTCEHTLRRAGFSYLQVHQVGYAAGQENGMLWASRE